MMDVAPRMPRRAPDAALLPGARTGRSSRSYLLRTVTVGSVVSPCAGAVWAAAPALMAISARAIGVRRSVRQVMGGMDASCCE